MAISDTQKVDYLWKKIGYAATKSDTNANKKAPNEAIASPLQLRGDKVMQQADTIPSTQPASSTGVVTVYPTSAPIECTADNTATANRTWKTGQTDWISPEFGSTYQVKVYIHTSSDAAGATGGDQVFATGSGNDDEWFFDYQSGVLHFIGTNLPNGISFSGKSVYIAGARYSGTFGVGGNLAIAGDSGSDTVVSGQTLTIQGTANEIETSVSGQTFTIGLPSVVSVGAFQIDDNRLRTTSTNEEIIIEPAGTGYVAIDATTGLIVPTGTTGERPTGQTGMMRFNTTTSLMEVFNGTAYVNVGGSTVTLDEFDGNGSDTAFTLSQTGSAASTIVSINGTVQEATNTYTVSGTTLTFNEEPATGDKIQVRNFFGGSELQPASKFQSYTTTQRNALSPSNGDVVYNSTTHKFQGYANGGWVDFH